MNADPNEHDIPTEQIGQRARAAAGWQFLSKGINTGLQMVTSIVLARLLMPKDFGIVAMATMVTGLAGVFSDLGLGQALVQRREITPEHTRSAFWGTLVMGLLLCGSVILAAPWVGVFFKEPRMVPVLRLTSLTFVMSPFAVVPRSLLQRNLDFRTPFFAGLASSVAYGAVGITMALMGYTYWSLVGGALASAFASTVALCILTHHVPPLVPTFRGIRDLYSFGVGVTGCQSLNYMAGQLDYLIVGRRLNAEALGLYSRAFGLVDAPRTILSSAGSPVLFPAFAALQTDSGRAKSAFGKVVRIMATVSFPSLALMGVSAPEFIPLVFGEQWRGAVVPTQLLIIAGMFRVVTNPGGALIMGLGRVHWAVACQAVYTFTLAGGAWYGANWGVEGVAIAVVFSSIVYFTAIAYAANRACSFSLRDYATHTASPILVATATAAAAFAARSLLIRAIAPGGLLLVATVTAGVLAGLIALLGPARSRWAVLEDVTSIIKSWRGQRNAA